MPDKPSIAVLAFDNLGSDPEQEYFADGVSEDIIATLSRSRSLFVIARNSSFTYKGRAVDVRQVAHELGVRYVLEGSVRRSGARVRVVAQLIEAESGKHVWAERYDRALEDVFAVQDQRGLWHLSKANTTDNAQAREFFHRATSIDSTLGSAHAAMAMTHLLEGGYGTRPLEDAIRLGKDSAGKAIEIDADDAEGQASLAFATAFAGNLEDVLHRYFEGDYGNALAMAKRAISRYKRGLQLPHESSTSISAIARLGATGRLSTYHRRPAQGGLAGLMGWSFARQPLALAEGRRAPDAHGLRDR